MGKKIFVIDDNSDIVEVTVAVLQLAKFDVTGFTSAKDVLERLRNGDVPDLVITDMRMPEIGGSDFCRSVRADLGLRDLKLVFFTASSDANHALLEESQVLGFIFKPFDNDDLVKQIDHYLSL